jgi:hypothetical protein
MKKYSEKEAFIGYTDFHELYGLVWKIRVQI